MLPPGRPTIVSVQDFKVEKESSSTDQQALGGGRARALIDQVKSATGMQSNQVVDLMASSLVSDLNRGGVKAQRLAAGQPLPKSGWLVRGIFTEVDQGSRALRAEVGFGAGSTDLAVLVNVGNLQKGKPESFYKLETQAGSRKLPGAVVTRNPYVAAAKFVMSRRDLPKNIRQTAQTIAAALFALVVEQIPAPDLIAMLGSKSFGAARSQAQMVPLSGLTRIESRTGPPGIVKCNIPPGRLLSKLP